MLSPVEWRAQTISPETFLSTVRFLWLANTPLTGAEGSEEMGKNVVLLKFREEYRDWPQLL